MSVYQLIKQIFKQRIINKHNDENNYMYIYEQVKTFFTNAYRNLSSCTSNSCNYKLNTQTLYVQNTKLHDNLIQLAITQICI